MLRAPVSSSPRSSPTESAVGGSPGVDVRSTGGGRSGRSARRLAGLALALLAVAAVALAAWLGYRHSLQDGTETLRRESNHRLDLFAAVVESRLRRLEPVPATVQLNPAVLAVLRQPRQPQALAAASDYLSRLNAHVGSLAVYVLDERGTVIASSNPDQPDDSRLGQDVSFRPYYLEALAGRATRHFAIGIGGQEPGYFVAHPIHDGARVRGVAAIKISLSPLEQTWEMLGAPALVADAHQVVILSSRAEWRYTSLVGLTTERRVDLQLTRHYGDLRLPRFPLDVSLSVDEDSQELQGQLPGGLSPRRGAPWRPGVMVLGRSLDGMDWRVLIFSDLRGVQDQAALAGLGQGLAVAFVGLLALFLAQRRRIEHQKRQAKRQLEDANAQLEAEVARRTQELVDANAQLRQEVSEREQAEATLRAAQDELVHAGKMALLGQLAAGITHELTQPLGAIRTLAGNAAEFMRRDQMAQAQENLSIVARLVDQMGVIIDPLKGFARKSAAVPVATDVGRVLGQALFLFDLRLRHDRVQVANLVPAGTHTAWCDPNRLEQVLVNLLANALDAMRDAPNRALRLSVELVDMPMADPAAEQAAAPVSVPAEPPASLPAAESPVVRPLLILSVTDTGPGLSADNLQRLFEPFYTTKPGGAGLGLGLAISRDIAREFGGDLQAGNAPEGGACFRLSVPAAPIPPNPPNRPNPIP